jgi:hypothetical protein
VEKGNYVCFGPGEGDNYIKNKRSGKKLMLKENGRGSYLMEVSFDKGDKTQITVDSGAEENVCPAGWGSQFPKLKAKREMHFKDASGTRIPHLGAKQVLLRAPF